MLWDTCSGAVGAVQCTGVGDRCLHAAAGGVGSFAVQLARAAGVTVIGTASERNHEYLRSLGVVPVAYGEGLVERVRELSPDGVDAAFDTAGRGALLDLIALAGGPDHVATIADPAAQEYGVTLTSGAEGRAYHALGLAAQLYEEGRLTVPVAETFRFGEAARAHQVSEEGHVRGKLVLVP